MKPRILLLLVGIAAVVLGIDQTVKALIVATIPENRSVPVLGDIFQLRHVTNDGAAFSLGSGFTWVLSIVAIGVVGVIIWFAPRIRSVAWAVMLGVVLGGALGNLGDRLFRPPGFGEGEVIDYIQIWGFPAIFNFADIAIVCGMGLFVILSFRGIGLDGEKHVDADSDPIDADLDGQADDADAVETESSAGSDETDESSSR